MIGGLYHCQCVEVICLCHVQVFRQAVQFRITNVRAVEKREEVEHRQGWQEPPVELLDELSLGDCSALARQPFWLRFLLGYNGLLPGQGAVDRTILASGGHLVLERALR